MANGQVSMSKPMYGMGVGLGLGLYGDDSRLYIL